MNNSFKKMFYYDFFQWKDYKAQQKLLKSTNRVLLRDIVSIKAKRENICYLLKVSLMMKHTQHWIFSKKGK